MYQHCIYIYMYKHHIYIYIFTWMNTIYIYIYIKTNTVVPPILSLNIAVCRTLYHARLVALGADGMGPCHRRLQALHC